MTVNGVWNTTKLERCLRETGRALAFTNFLLTGKLELPRLAPRRFHIFDEKSEYENALVLATDTGALDDKGYEEATRLGGTFVKHEYVGYEVIESGLESMLLTMCADRAVFGTDREPMLVELQPGLVGGALNYVSLTALGTRLPLFAIEEQKEERTAFSRTSGLTEREIVRRQKLLKLADAGIAGGRAWLQYLAERREDPPLAATLVDQLGRLQGDALLKATFVFEMLAEDGPAVAFLRKVPDAVENKTPSALFEAACGTTLAEFEAQWREWFVPERPGLAQRLGAPLVDESLKGDEKATLDALVAIRRRAGIERADLDFDRTAATNCCKHADYLARHPEQLAAWPDAHEEYPDQEGFDPEGAWAGNHSVIAPGVRDGAEALDGWMSTFYHRLPLLDPGLVRIGYALANHCGVLDAGTFVSPHEFRSVVAGMGTGTVVERWGIVWRARRHRRPHPIPRRAAAAGAGRGRVADGLPDHLPADPPLQRPSRARAVAARRRRRRQAPPLLLLDARPSDQSEDRARGLVVPDPEVSALDGRRLHRERQAHDRRQRDGRGRLRLVVPLQALSGVTSRSQARRRAPGCARAPSPPRPLGARGRKHADQPLDAAPGLGEHVERLLAIAALERALGAIDQELAEQQQCLGTVGLAVEALAQRRLGPLARLALGLDGDLELLARTALRAQPVGRHALPLGHDLVALRAEHPAARAARIDREHRVELRRRLVDVVGALSEQRHRELLARRRRARRLLGDELGRSSVACATSPAPCARSA